MVQQRKNVINLPTVRSTIHANLESKLSKKLGSIESVSVKGRRVKQLRKKYTKAD